MSQERTTTTQVTAASIQLWLRIKLQNNNNNRGKCQEFDLEILELPSIYFIHMTWDSKEHTTGNVSLKQHQQFSMYCIIPYSTGCIRILWMSDFQNMLKAER